MHLVGLEPAGSPISAGGQASNPWKAGGGESKFWVVGSSALVGHRPTENPEKDTNNQEKSKEAKTKQYKSPAGGQASEPWKTEIEESKFWVVGSSNV